MLRKKLLIIAFVAAGSLFSFAVSANTCPSASPQGVGCTSGSYYCASACRSGLSWCPTWSPSTICASGLDCSNCSSADACGVCNACNSGYRLCGAYPNSFCKANGTLPANCATYNTNCDACASCVAGYTLSGSSCVAATLKLGSSSVSGSSVVQGGADSALFVSGNKIGLGISAPTANLQINSSADTEGLRIITSNYSPFIIRNNADTADLFRIDENGNITSLGSVSGSNTYWNLNGSNLVASSTNWNVGIGTTNPLRKLDIMSTSSSQMRLSYDSSNYVDVQSSSNGSLFFYPKGGRTYFAGVGANNEFYAYDYSVTAPYPYLSLSAHSLVLNMPANSGAGAVRLTDNGSSYLTGGNVGVGLTNPGAKLDVSGALKVSSSAQISLLGGSGNRMVTVDNTGVFGTAALPTTVGAGTSGQTLRHDGTSWVANSVLYNNGTNVGIGTTNPGAKFEVYGAGANTDITAGTDESTYLRFKEVGSPRFAFRNITASDYLGIYDYGQSSDTMVFRAGNVGIGTTNPGAKLDVAGDVNLNNQAVTTAGSLNRGYYVYRSGTTSYGLKLQYTGGEYGPMIFGPNQANRFISFGKVGAAMEDDDMVEQMRLDLDTGSLGIGNTNPGAKLDVNGSIRATSATLSLLTGTGSRIVMTDASGSLYATSSSVVTGLPSSSTAGQTLRSDGNSWLANSVLYNNGTNVGIGMTNPSYKLDVANSIGVISDGSYPGIISRAYSDTGFHGAWFANYRARGSVSSPLAVQSGDYLGWYDYWAYNGSSFTRSAQWIVSADGSPVSGNFPSKFVFSTVNQAGVFGEKMRITADGNIGIGLTNPSTKLDISGSLKVSGSAQISLLGGSGNRMVTVDNTGVFGTAALPTTVGAGTSGQTLRHDGTNWVANSVLYNNGANVGIGTTAPQSKLEVSLGAESSVPVAGADSAYFMLTGSGAYGMMAGVLGSGNGYIQQQRFDGTTTTYNLLLQPNGSNVGIGTINPSSILTVNGPVETGRAGILGNYDSTQVQGVWSIGNGYQISTVNNNFGSQYGLVYAHTNASSVGTSKGPISGWGHQILFTSAGDYKAAISLSSGHAYFAGNVGIGTTNPGAKLDVNGSIRATSATLSLLSGTGGRIVMADASGSLYATSSSVATGLPSSSTAGQTLRSDGTNWVANSTLYNNGTNIGIGTTSPIFKLDLMTGAGPFAAMRVGYPGSSLGMYLGRVSTNSYYSYIGDSYYQTGGNWRAPSTTGSAIRFKDAGGVGIFVDSGLTAGTDYVPTERLSMATNGNVGIGITNPNSRLHIYNSAANAEMDLQSVVGASNHWALYNNLSDNSFRVWGGSDYLSILRNGNVGIGTTNPVTPLEVSQNYTGDLQALTLRNSHGSLNDKVSLVFQNTSATSTYRGSYITSERVNASAANDLYFSTSPDTSSPTEKMRITGSGNVGIGTTNPAGKLDVNGTFSIAGNNIISMPSNNPEVGPWNPIWNAIGSGKPLYFDEEFASGSNSVNVYNNSGGTAVTITRLTGQTGIPNSTGVTLKISYDGVGASSPGFGGFYQPFTPVANRTYVQRFRAKLPIGRNLVLTENSQGTNNTSYWLTNTAGTGKWEDYIRVSHAGNTGTFSNGGHVYVSGGSGAFDWYLASINVYEVNTPIISSPNTWIGAQTFSGGASFPGSGVWNSSGNVGIGITNPSTKLDISGSLKVSGSAQISLLGGSGNRMVTVDNTGTFGTAALPTTVGAGTSGQTLRHDGTSWVANSVLYNNGANIGIGTTNPGAKLDIAGTTGELVRIASGAALSDVNYITLGNLRGFLGYDGASGNLVTLQSGNGKGISFNVSSDTFGSGPLMRLTATGNVGIGTTAPGAYKLNVAGSIYATGLTMGGDINLGGNNLSGINKLTVSTIDPLYNIKGVNYSTFASAIVGGVKEEYVGRINIDKQLGENEYEKIVDFDKLEKGSDLWVWRQVVDFSPENIQVLITPYGNFASAYYEISGNRLIFKADRPASISYRLIGKRFDWQSWPTKARDQKEKAGLIIH